MNVYTITFQYAPNYGAILQAYALSQYLKEQGHDVKVINYLPPQITEMQLWYKNWFRKLSIKHILLLPFDIQQSCLYARFRRRRLNLTQVCQTPRDVEKLPGADLYLTGSDQVWNAEETKGVDLAYFLDLQVSGVKASYAASAGRDEIPPEVLSEMIPLIRKLDRVSVREEELQRTLIECGLQNVRHVQDPVFLLSKEHYEQIAKPTIKGKYVLTYYCDADGIVDDLALRIAKEMGCKVIKIGKIKSTPKYQAAGTVSPEEFLGLFSNAAFIVTSSFHGTAFSIVFRKSFYAVTAGGRSSRITSLLRSFGLEDRYVDKGTTVEQMPITPTVYTQAEEKIRKWQTDSQAYLTECLKCAEDAVGKAAQR